MSLSAIIFYAVSAFMLTTALLAVTSRKIFRAAIWLLLSLVGIAAFYFWLQVEFIAAVQIVVYVGGIVVLIIFSIFLTHQSGKEMPKPLMKRTISSALAALFGLAFSYNLIAKNDFGEAAKAATQPFNSSVSEIGTQMLSTTEHGYILPFEVVSILLLSAMIGCIVIAIKSPEIKAAEILASDNNNNGIEINPLIPEPLITEAL